MADKAGLNSSKNSGSLSIDASNWQPTLPPIFALPEKYTDNSFIFGLRRNFISTAKPIDNVSVAYNDASQLATTLSKTSNSILFSYFGPISTALHINKLFVMLLPSQSCKSS